MHSPSIRTSTASDSSDSEIDPDSCFSNLAVQKSSLFPILNRSQRVIRESKILGSDLQSRFSPWLISLAYPFGRYGVLPAYFKQIEVIGREHLPRTGPVILAPTHQSRWDAVVVPYAAGYDITGRHLRFMVSSDEVAGLQGWFIRRLGGFAVDTRRPAIATLRYGIELLQAGEVLVIFPEGNIFRETTIQPLKPGLARLALQAEASQPQLGIQVVPMRLNYSNPLVSWQSNVKVQIGSPLAVANYDLQTPKQSACHLTNDLQKALENLVID